MELTRHATIGYFLSYKNTMYINELLIVYQDMKKTILMQGCLLLLLLILISECYGWQL